MAKFCRVYLERAHVHISRKKFFALVIVVLFVLNLFTFSLAYSTITHADLYGDNKPRDFSVYYVTVWRMFHDPSQIFTAGYLHDGEPVTRPFLTPYKYLPSFLILISPLASLSYYPALWGFDLFQLALLPLIGILLYSFREKASSSCFRSFVYCSSNPQPVPGGVFDKLFFFNGQKDKPRSCSHSCFFSNSTWATLVVQSSRA